MQHTINIINILIQFLNIQSTARGATSIFALRRHEMQQSKQYTNYKSYITDNNKV